MVDGLWPIEIASGIFMYFQSFDNQIKISPVTDLDQRKRVILKDLMLGPPALLCKKHGKLYRTVSIMNDQCEKNGIIFNYRMS